MAWRFLVDAALAWAFLLSSAGRRSGLLGLERRGAPEGEAAAGDSAGASASAATALMMTATATVYWGTDLAAGQPVAPASIPAGAWPGLLASGAVATFPAIQGFYAGAQLTGA